NSLSALRPAGVLTSPNTVFVEAGWRRARGRGLTRVALRGEPVCDDLLHGDVVFEERFSGVATGRTKATSNRAEQGMVSSKRVLTSGGGAERRPTLFPRTKISAQRPGKKV
ncbi:hypothetical protein INR49_022745, partial [Caranx melampygus]